MGMNLVDGREVGGLAAEAHVWMSCFVDVARSSVSPNCAMSLSVVLMIRTWRYCLPLEVLMRKVVAPPVLGAWYCGELAARQG